LTAAVGTVPHRHYDQVTSGIAVGTALVRATRARDLVAGDIGWRLSR
jgi:hypothetical protein